MNIGTALLLATLAHSHLTAKECRTLTNQLVHWASDDYRNCGNKDLYDKTIDGIDDFYKNCENKNSKVDY